MMLGYIKDDAVAPLEASEKLYPMPMTPIGTYEGVRGCPIKVSGEMEQRLKGFFVCACSEFEDFSQYLP